MYVFCALQDHTYLLYLSCLPSFVTMSLIISYNLWAETQHNHDHKSVKKTHDYLILLELFLDTHKLFNFVQKLFVLRWHKENEYILRIKVTFSRVLCTSTKWCDGPNVFDRFWAANADDVTHLFALHWSIMLCIDVN